MVTKTEYRRNGVDTPIEIEIKHAVSFAEMAHIINAVVEASFDDDGNYTPFEADIQKWGQILNFFTNIDKEQVGNIGDVWTLMTESDVQTIVEDVIGKTIAKINDYVFFMVEAKQTENPLRPILKLLGAMSDTFSKVDVEKVIAETMKDKGVQDAYLTLIKNEE